MIAGIARRLSQVGRRYPGQSAIRIDQIVRNRIVGSDGLSDCRACARNHVVPIHESFDVQPMIADVRGFDHSILHNFPRDSQIPLPALRRMEVLANREERSRDSKRTLQPWINGIEAAEIRTIVEGSASSSKTCINGTSPGRIAA